MILIYIYIFHGTSLVCFNEAFNVSSQNCDFWTGFYRYLSDLHAPGDPAWQCIGAQHQWILKLMHNCKENYVKEQKGKDIFFVIYTYICLTLRNLALPFI